MSIRAYALGKGAGMASDRPGSDGNRYFLDALPFLVMAVIVALDLSLGPSDEFVPVLSLGPALASVSRRALPTAFIGMLALALGSLLASYDSLFSTRRGITALITIFGGTVACVVASAIRERKERELADVKAVAEAAQQVPDLRTAPVHHDGLHPHGSQQHDVLGEGGERPGLSARGAVPGQRVAPVLDDDHRVAESPDVGKGLDEQRRALGVEPAGSRVGGGRGHRHDVVRFSSM